MTEPSGPPPTGTLAASIAGWARDRMGQRGVTYVIFSLMAALAAWVAVLVPSGGDVRGKPLFWALALPPMVWVGAVAQPVAWALRLLWPVLWLAPVAAVGGLVAGTQWAGAGANASPGMLLALCGVSAGLSGLGARAIRRSALPGGSARAEDLPPVPAGLPPLLRAALQVASVSLSGTLVNGILFGTTILGDADGTLLSYWPILVPVAAIVLTGGLMLRGAAQTRHGDGAAWRTLRTSIVAGGIGSCVPLAMLWAWPYPSAVKIGFSVFMVPMAIAALWTGRIAQRWLTDAMP